MVNPLFFSRQRYLVFVSSQINSIGHKAIDNNQSGFADIGAKVFRQSQNRTENPLNDLQHYKLHKDFSWKVFSSKQIFIRKKFSSCKETSTCTNTRADSQFAPKRILFVKRHNIEQLCASHQTLLRWKWQILPLKYSVWRQEKSNNRHDQGITNQTLTQKTDSRKHWEKQKTIVVDINSSTQPIKSVIITRKTASNMMKIEETHAQLKNFSLCNSIKRKITFQQPQNTKICRL